MAVPFASLILVFVFIRALLISRTCFWEYIVLVCKKVGEVLFLIRNIQKWSKFVIKNHLIWSMDAFKKVSCKDFMGKLVGINVDVNLGKPKGVGTLLKEKSPWIQVIHWFITILLSLLWKMLSELLHLRK